MCIKTDHSDWLIRITSNKGRVYRREHDVC